MRSRDGTPIMCALKWHSKHNFKDWICLRVIHITEGLRSKVVETHKSTFACTNFGIRTLTKC